MPRIGDFDYQSEIAQLRDELAKWKDVANQIVPFDPENDDQIFDALQAWLKKYEAAKEALKIAVEALRDARWCLTLVYPPKDGIISEEALSARFHIEKIDTAVDRIKQIG